MEEPHIKNLVKARFFYVRPQGLAPPSPPPVGGKGNVGRPCVSFGGRSQAPALAGQPGAYLPAVLRRTAPRAARPRPISAKLAGSGTAVVGGVTTGPWPTLMMLLSMPWVKS